MEGLEATEELRSTLNDDARLDAEYFKKRYISEDTDVCRHEVKTLGELAFITDGQHGYHEVDEASPIHMLTARSARGWFADTLGADTIAKWVDDNNKRSSLQTGDLILSTRGTVGLCAIIKPNVLPANIDQDVARVFVTLKGLSPEYLLAYINSRYGQDWMARNQSGMVQQGLSLAKVRSMPVPLLSGPFQRRVVSVVESAFLQLQQSRNLYTQAEDLLLTELGLKDWQPEKPLSYEATRSQASAAGRLDAEYFSPAVQKLIGTLERSGTRVSDVATLRKEQFIPNPRQTFQYIEIGQLRANGTAGSSEVWGGDAPSRATWVVHKGDVITSTVRPVRRLTAIVSDNQDGSVCSSGFAVLKPTKIPSELLLTYLRLPLVADLMDLHTTASMYPAISVENILALPFALPEERATNDIVDRVNASFEAGRESKALLDKAKRAVEIAIEKGEDSAMTYLDGKAYVQSRVLPAMTEDHKYFDLTALKTYLSTQKLTYKSETVNAYISRMKREGKIFSAGRGWYSSIPEIVELDHKPIEQLSTDMENCFPLLDFACWSTAQINPYLHHLLGKFVQFLYVERDAMPSVLDALQDLDYSAYLNPTRREVTKSFVIADRTVIIRPSVSRAPVEKHYARAEKLLVDLYVERNILNLMDQEEFQEAARKLISSRRIELAKLITYATQRRISWRELFLDPASIIAEGASE